MYAYLSGASLQVKARRMQQEDLLQRAVEFAADNADVMTYALPMAATMAPTIPIRDRILFVFLGPSVETIDGRDNNFWNPFKKPDGTWLHTIIMCEDVLHAIARKIDMPEDNALRSLDNVFLMDLYPWVQWDSKTKHKFTDREQQLCREWFDSNVKLIQPAAVIIFTMDASFGADGKDLLSLNMSNNEGDANISVSDVTGFMSVQTRGLDTCINVVCHPGALSYVNNNTDEQLTDFVRAFTSLHAFLDNSVPDNNPNAFADAIIDEIFAKAARIKSSIRQYQTERKEREFPHTMTLSEIQEQINAMEMSVCDATLRKYLADNVVGKRGSSNLYDLTK